MFLDSRENPQLLNCSERIAPLSTGLSYDCGLNQNRLFLISPVLYKSHKDFFVFLVVDKNVQLIPPQRYDHDGSF